MESQQKVRLRRRAQSIQAGAATISRTLDLVVTLACATIVAFLCISTFVGVIFRYVLEQPLGWPEETSRFGLVWLSLLAASRALRRGEHIALGFVVARLPLLWRRVVRQTVNVVMMLFVGGVIFQAAEYLEIVGPSTATATGISMMWPYLGLVISFGVILLVLILEIVDGFCTAITGESASLAVAAAENGVELLNANPLVDRSGDPELLKEH